MTIERLTMLSCVSTSSLPTSSLPSLDAVVASSSSSAMYGHQISRWLSLGVGFPGRLITSSWKTLTSLSKKTSICLKKQFLFVASSSRSFCKQAESQVSCNVSATAHPTISTRGKFDFYDKIDGQTLQFYKEVRLNDMCNKHTVTEREGRACFSSRDQFHRGDGGPGSGVMVRLEGVCA